MNEKTIKLNLLKEMLDTLSVISSQLDEFTPSEHFGKINYCEKFIKDEVKKINETKA